MTDIYFIRHGQASFGSKDYDQLSETGRRQADILADYFIDMEAYFPVIYCGTKKRQMDTAKTILSRLIKNDVGCELKIFPGLNEFDVSNLLSRCKDDMIQKDASFFEDLKHAAINYHAFQNIFVKVLQESLDKKYEDSRIENFCRFQERVRSTIATIVEDSKRYKKVAVVTSGGVLALLMQTVFGLTDAEAIDLVWFFYNASITVFNTETDELVLKIKNSVSHFNRTEYHHLLTYV